MDLTYTHRVIIVVHHRKKGIESWMTDHWPEIYTKQFVRTRSDLNVDS